MEKNCVVILKDLIKRHLNVSYKLCTCKRRNLVLAQGHFNMWFRGTADLMIGG